MIDLDRRRGPWSGRVWGLLLNLFANALALYGLAGYLQYGERVVHLALGSGLTAFCLLILAIPSRETGSGGGRRPGLPEAGE